MVLCLLAADEDDDRDVALQIHFTLIQAFCCENDIDILRVSNPGRLAELLLLGADAGGEGAAQPPDLHCVLVTVSTGRRSAGRGRGEADGDGRRGRPVCPPGAGGLSAEKCGFHHRDFLGTEHVSACWRPPRKACESAGPSSSLPSSLGLA